MPLSLFHLHGDIRDLRLPRLLAALREDGFTGVFQATTRESDGAGEGGETTREIHFSSGHIAWAISTDREESLRSYLLRHRAIDEKQWAEAEERAREGTLRQSLIGLGLLDARELAQIEKGRAEEIVQALFGARHGEYRVRERHLSPGTPDLKIDPRPVILKGVLERADRALILDEIGSLDTVYVVKRPALEDQGQGLPGEFQSVLRHIDGKRSIAQICSVTSLPDNYVCSVVAALSMIGAVRRNYEKSAARPRGEIVRGLEVGQSARQPVAASPPPGRPDPPPPASPAAVQESLPVAGEDVREQATVPDATPPAAAPAVAGGATEQPPPIVTRPFEGEGPVTPLEPRQAAEVEEENPIPVLEVDEEEEQEAPVAGEIEPSQPRRIDRSIYAHEAAPDTSRPWFLLGGAAAVGFAALFLILMTQNPGGAEEALRPVTEAVPEARVPAEPENGNSADTTDAPAAPPAVAPPAAASILSDAPSAAVGSAGMGNGEDGHGSLIAGDLRSAARQFGREVAATDAWSIQLLTACQDETVLRAVRSAGSSSSLFILSTTLEGRSCYRVYWGRYPSETRAREALRHEVPPVFRQDRNQPRVTRLGGS